MTVKKAKKILKNIPHTWDENRKYYKKVVWNHRRKVFFCDTYCGQRMLIMI